MLFLLTVYSYCVEEPMGLCGPCLRIGDDGVATVSSGIVFVCLRWLAACSIYRVLCIVGGVCCSGDSC